MTVILFNKKTETLETINDAVWFKRVAVSIGFSDTKFRYEWHMRIKNCITAKSFPCNRYDIYAIIA